MKNLIILLISVFYLSGCAEIQVQQAKQEERQIVDDCKQKWKDPKFDSLRDKVAPYGEIVPTRYILVEEKPTEAEKKVLLQYADLRDECASKYFDFLYEKAPYGLPAFSENRERGTIGFFELYNRNISYGEYNRLKTHSSTIYLQRLQESYNEYAKLSVAAQRNQIEASKNLLQASQQLTAPQPQLQRNMTHTNCRWAGNQINCTSF